MKKIRFYKRLLTEVIETLITICMVLSRDANGICGGRYRNILESHINELGGYSHALRAENKDRVDIHALYNE